MMNTQMKPQIQMLPVPDHYDFKHAQRAEFNVNDANALIRKAEIWKQKHGLKPVGSDKTKVHMLVIDDQVDFTFPSGSLFVAGRSGTGAMDAQNNLVQFIYRYIHVLSQITCTMDTHLPYQVFFTSAHLRDDGSHPDAHTIVSADEYRRGKFQPNPAMAKQLGADLMWLRRQFIHYCEQLEASGKYQLYLWPYHCLLGSNGHRLAGVVEEARLFHSFARGAENRPEIKGGNPLTEHYSIFAPEVTTCWDSRPIPGAQKNTHLVKTLMEADVVLMAGLASSHCVRGSIADFLGEIQRQDPKLAKKVYILRDCTAAVVVPGGPDFTDEAERAFQNFKDAGMHIVNSTDPIESWPEIQATGLC
ncbi:MAG TPA: nicotinamidase [Acidobacteriota bacterium]|nr:nicotinamidase [Acidobacteriota bacterium]HNB71982.1 nicotinamidase [Acidobacteriota bacterium]HND18034.1 nicotinamidase [Acidobacteriota bacterium]HNG93193.1 nicotinamidase [Acidobacteriota bacterium]HNH85286.1 nicotinamidase [Acidobacteriota bacterium]